MHVHDIIHGSSSMFLNKKGKNIKLKKAFQQRKIDGSITEQSCINVKN